MKFLIYSLATFIMYGLLLNYLFINIVEIGEGSPALNILYSSFIIGLILLAENIRTNGIYIKKSFLVLIIFFTYYTLKIFLDTGDISEVKKFTITTTGGIILFYILGVLFSNTFIEIKSKILISKQALKIYRFLFFIFSLFFLYLLIDTFIELLSRLRTDIFLISDLDGNYQRPGSFLAISFIITSILFNFTMIISYKKKCFYNNLYMISISTIYLFSNILGIIFSQMIGSNNTFIVLCGILFATILFQVFLIFSNNRTRLELRHYKLKSFLYGSISKKMIISFLISIFIFVTIVILAIQYLELDIEKFRIMGFGSGETSSVVSRIALLDNFIIHFSDSPIFGNFIIDRITTGIGTYIHSFLGSLLTHFGIIGFFVFMVYLILSLLEYFRISSEDLYINNGMKIYLSTIFLGIFLISCVGTFITWVPIWFLFGFVMIPISRKRRIIAKNNINSFK